MCEKVAFSNKQKAHQAMKRIYSKGKTMRVYHCPYCFKYHLTSEINKSKI